MKKFFLLFAVAFLFFLVTGCGSSDDGKNDSGDSGDSTADTGDTTEPTDTSYFIAMELVNGKDLKVIRQRLKRVELLMPVEQSAYIISQVCDGLDYAHRKTDEHMNSLNIVHRDVSPQNIIVSYEGNVKLIDFGIAKAQSKSTKTQAGMVKGKFSYMSPEQVNGKVLDRRSDIFSRSTFSAPTAGREISASLKTRSSTLRSTRRTRS